MAGVLCQFRVSIPEGAQAGTVLSIDRGQGDNLKVLVPEGAARGDELLLTKTAGGAWSASTVLGGLPAPDSTHIGATGSSDYKGASASTAPGPSLEELAAARERTSAESPGALSEEGADALRAELAVLRRELSSKDEWIRQLSSKVKDSGGEGDAEESAETSKPLRPGEAEELRKSVAERDAEILRLRTGFELLGREIVRLHGALRGAAEARFRGRSDGMFGRPLGVVPDWAGSSSASDKRLNPAATSSTASELRGEASRIQERLGSGTVLHEAVGGLRSSIAALEEALAAAAESHDLPGSASTNALGRGGALGGSSISYPLGSGGSMNSGTVPAASTQLTQEQCSVDQYDHIRQAAPWPGAVQGQRSPSPAVRVGATAPMGWQATAQNPSSWNARPGSRVVQAHSGYPGAAP